MQAKGWAERTLEPFEFHPELFAVRMHVLEVLSDCGFVWLSDFAAVDLAHDIHGLEVTGIRLEADADAIEAALRFEFPGWQFARKWYEDENVGELGWKVLISRDREKFDDAAMTHVSLRPEDDHRTRWQFLRRIGERLSKLFRGSSRR